MMDNQHLILCVDDERAVLDSILYDLKSLRQWFSLDVAESITEAREVIDDFQANGGQLALIVCDHRMPQFSGIDFLIELNHNEATSHCQKILLTGQAGLNELIDAVSRGGINQHIPKPWQSEYLRKVVVEALQKYLQQYYGELPERYQALQQLIAVPAPLS